MSCYLSTYINSVSIDYDIKKKQTFLCLLLDKNLLPSILLCLYILGAINRSCTSKLPLRKTHVVLSLHIFIVKSFFRTEMTVFSCIWFSLRREGLMPEFSLRQYGITVVNFSWSSGNYRSLF